MRGHNLPYQVVCLLQHIEKLELDALTADAFEQFQCFLERVDS